MNETLNELGFTGRYFHKATAEIFALKIVEVSDLEFGKPYHLRNERGYRECSEKEFKEQFVKL